MSSSPTSIVSISGEAMPQAFAHAVADLVAIDPTIRVMTGTVFATVDGNAFGSTMPALWIWSTDDRFAPRLFQESTLACSLEQAWRYIQKERHQQAASKRAADEAEGGIIIPDYMY